MNIYTFPAGKYFIGDVISVLNEGDWEKWKTLSSGFFSFKNNMVASFPTRFGCDEIYESNIGFEFQSYGYIGILPEHLISREDEDFDIRDYKVIEFEKDFEVNFNYDLFKVGHVEIYLNGK